MITTERLHHGGIMANYRCTAACRHCLYSCSPTRTDGYINEETAKIVCELLRIGGCRSIHIGGGEPFLDFDGLLTIVRTVTRSGIRVEYIETNAFWAEDSDRTERYLRDLAQSGADTLCISLDPFHVEYVPVALPLSLAGSCQRIGFGFFLWQDKYLGIMSQLDKRKTYNRTELEELISPGYICETSRSYGLHMGGRAINIETECSTLRPVDEIINDLPCRGLLSGNHFHVDMYGRYIPPGCTGIAIPLDEAVHGISEGNYTVFESLLHGGTAALIQYAKELGFVPDPRGYTSRCALCIFIRSWLSENTSHAELDREHYIESVMDL